MTIPVQPKIYHIVHVDRLPSIVGDQYLWSDAKMVGRSPQETTIGMSHIKQRRLNELRLNSHPHLHVGNCVPFYFCPRSIMLYLIYKKNPELQYQSGQDLILHLEADFHATVLWAKQNNYCWTFTLSNAGARIFEDYNDLTQLHRINWQAVAAEQWSGKGIASSISEGKQAEFLVECKFPWHLVERIGTCSQLVYQRIVGMLASISHQPQVEILPRWYY